MSEELRLRIVSALVLAIVVLAAAWLGGVWFAALAQVIALLVYYEWTTITGARTDDIHVWRAGWVAVALIALDVLFGSDIPLPQYTLAGIALLVVIYAALRCRNYWNLAGIAYAALTGVSLAAIRGDDITGLVAILFLFAIVWGTDIAAYFTGRAIGGPKLAPAISPGKTWSGAIGGLVAAVACSALLVLFFLKNVTPWIIGLSLFLSILSQTGDLFESFLKRRYKVKDSSRLIPGHGGVLDRIDGLVFACFGAFLLAQALAPGNMSVGAFLLGAPAH